ncbi:MAG: hypothetical protein ACE5G2_01270 [Candidatus Krumholzibacteriia bacterium]
MPDGQRRERRPAGGGQLDREIGLRGIVWFGIGLAILIAVSGVLTWVLFRSLNSRQIARDQPRSPLVVESPRHLPPEPRLQAAPERELANVRAEEDSLLHSYGWVDPRAGVARIPIETSMELLVQRGLPTRRDVRPWSPPGVWRDPTLQKLPVREGTP